MILTRFENLEREVFERALLFETKRNRQIKEQKSNLFSFHEIVRNFFGFKELQSSLCFFGAN
jgi:hypothetical protein